MMPQYEKKYDATIRLKLVSGKGLAAKDINGKSDPYVVIGGCAHKTPIKLKQDSSFVVKSQTKKNTLNPIWNENFEFKLGGLGMNKVIKFEVCALTLLKVTLPRPSAFTLLRLLSPLSLNILNL